jgi:hypothetical protein
MLVAIMVCNNHSFLPSPTTKESFHWKQQDLNAGTLQVVAIELLVSCGMAEHEQIKRENNKELYFMM